MWALSAGGLSQTSTAAQSTGFGPSTTFNRLYVVTQMHFDNTGGNTDQVAGVSQGDLPSPMRQYYACAALKHTGMGAGNYLGAFSLWTPPGTKQAATLGIGTIVGVDFLLTDNTLSGLSCSFETSSIATGFGVQAGPTTGKLHVYTENAAATYRYVFAVEIGS